MILLFNNLVNTGAATLVSVITLELFGNESWALGVATLLVTFAILVFSEITPKVIGANHADRLAPIVAYPLTGLLRAFVFRGVVHQPVLARAAEPDAPAAQGGAPARRCRSRSCARW